MWQIAIPGDALSTSLKLVSSPELQDLQNGTHKLVWASMLEGLPSMLAVLHLSSTPGLAMSPPSTTWCSMTTSLLFHTFDPVHSHRTGFSWPKPPQRRSLMKPIDLRRFGPCVLLTYLSLKILMLVNEGAQLRSLLLPLSRMLLSQANEGVPLRPLALAHLLRMPLPLCAIILANEGALMVLRLEWIDKTGQVVCLQ